MPSSDRHFKVRERISVIVASEHVFLTYACEGIRYTTILEKCLLRNNIIKVTGTFWVNQNQQLLAPGHGLGEGGQEHTKELTFRKEKERGLGAGLTWMSNFPSPLTGCPDRVLSHVWAVAEHHRSRGLRGLHEGLTVGLSYVPSYLRTLDFCNVADILQLHPVGFVELGPDQKI